MRRTALAIALAMTAAVAMAASPLELTRTPTDPSRMTMLRDGRNMVEDLIQTWAEPGSTGLTEIVWYRGEAKPWTSPQVTSAWLLGVYCSVDAARPTMQGGPPIQTVMGYDSITLVNGAWADATLIPADAPSYDGTVCATINVLTDADLTVTVGSEDIAVAATNTMVVRNVAVKGGARAVVITASRTDAQVKFGLGVQPWHEFRSPVGLDRRAEGLTGYMPWMLTNEWRCVVMRANASGASATSVRVAYAGWDPGQWYEESGTMTAPYLPHQMYRAMPYSIWGIHLAGGVHRYWQTWGRKHFDRVLSDAEIARIVEVDAAEMQRRGMGRYLILQ